MFWSMFYGKCFKFISRILILECTSNYMYLHTSSTTIRANVGCDDWWLKNNPLFWGEEHDSTSFLPFIPVFLIIRTWYILRLSVFSTVLFLLISAAKLCLIEKHCLGTKKVVKKSIRDQPMMSSILNGWTCSTKHGQQQR